MLYFYLFIFVQIVFESLPISSSGHLIVLEKLFEKLNLPLVLLPLNFDHFLHLFALLIMFFVFYPIYKDLLFLLFKIIFRKDFYSSPARRLILIIKKIFILGFVIDSITFIFYLIFKLDVIERYTHNSFLLCIGFTITALLLLCPLIKSRKGYTYQSLDLKKSIVLGIVQGLSLFSGISRFGSTYSVAILLGISSKRAFELSFLIQAPLCFAGFIGAFFSMLKNKDLYILLSPDVFFLILISSLISFYLFKLMYLLAKRKEIGFFAFYFIIPISLIIFISII